jgi:hypothetical protein
MKTTLFHPLESHGDPINNLHVECYGLASSSHKGFSEEKKGRNLVECIPSKKGNTHFSMGENQMWNKKHRNYMPHMWQKMRKTRSLLNPETLYMWWQNHTKNGKITIIIILKVVKKKILVILEGVGECWV